MAEHQLRWRRRSLVLTICLALIAVAGGLFFRSYATPTVRSDIANSLYTVGDQNYAAALSEGKKIVKFGRLPLGIYPGGVAFDNPKEARQHIVELGKEELGWRVYLLSGDFDLDTIRDGDRRYTNKSLQVLNVVDDTATRWLESSFKLFDQTPGSGWRSLADEELYDQAASLIVEYLNAHPEMAEQQVRILNFHAGQMLAYAGDNKSAISRFERSLAEEEPVDAPVKWNSYVRATIAFLANDKATLQACRQEIAAGPRLGDSIPNLDVVDSLLSCAGQPYSLAYEKHRGKPKTK